MISTNIYLATRATKEIRDMFLETQGQQEE